MNRIDQLLPLPLAERNWANALKFAMGPIYMKFPRYITPDRVLLRKVLAILVKFRVRLTIMAAVLAVIGGLAYKVPKLIAEREYDAAVAEALTLIDGPTGSDFHETIDRVRTFVNDHSKHRIDEAFYRMWKTPEVMARQVVAHARGEQKNLVHMECSTRSDLMERMFKKLGYRTRGIAIFNSQNLTSHSFIDVLNPNSGVWETQDADYDIFWKSRRTGKRVSVADAATSLDDLEPCGRTQCGWNTKSRERIPASFLRDYLDYIVVRFPNRGPRLTVYTQRANLRGNYEQGRKKGSYCDVMRKNCRDGFLPIASTDATVALTAATDDLR